MKISTEKLRALYQAEISARKPDSRRDCPTPGQLAALFGSSLSKRKKARIMDHVAGCGLCAEEFEAWRNFFLQRDVLLRDICAWAARRKSPGAESRVKDSRSEYSPSRRQGGEGTSKHVAWRYALAVAAALICLALFIGPLSVFKISRQDKLRASPPTSIELINPPQGRSVSRGSFSFRWTPLPKVDYYALEVFDETLAPVWKSPEIVQPVLDLPREVQDRLASDRPYYWLVTAVLSNAKRIESNIGVFSLKSR